MEPFRIGKPVAIGVVAEGDLLEITIEGEVRAEEDHLVVNAPITPDKPDREWVSIFESQPIRPELPVFRVDGGLLSMIVPERRLDEVWQEAKRRADQTNRVYMEKVVGEREQRAAEQEAKEAKAQANRARLEQAKRRVDELEP